MYSYKQTALKQLVIRNFICIYKKNVNRLNIVYKI